MRQLVMAVVLGVGMVLPLAGSAHSIMPNGDLEFNSHRVTEYETGSRRTQNIAGPLDSTTSKSGHQYSQAYSGNGCCAGSLRAECQPQVSCPPPTCMPVQAPMVSPQGSMPVCAAPMVKPGPGRVHRVDDNTLYPGKSNATVYPVGGAVVPAQRSVILNDKSGL